MCGVLCAMYGVLCAMCSVQCAVLPCTVCAGTNRANGANVAKLPAFDAVVGSRGKAGTSREINRKRHSKLAALGKRQGELGGGLVVLTGFEWPGG